eukprot:351166-Chlamydomonas_euryale.AAC.1
MGTAQRGCHGGSGRRGVMQDASARSRYEQCAHRGVWGSVRCGTLEVWTATQVPGSDPKVAGGIVRDDLRFPQGF